MMTIITKCPWCGEEHEVEVPFEGYLAWQNGELIQVAMPQLSADEREMLISGICPSCWEKAFPYLSPTEREQLISGICPKCQAKIFG